MDKSKIWWVFSFLALTLSLGQIFLGLTKIVATQTLQDFFVYYHAGEAFLNGGNPYDTVVHPAGPMQFLYPPPALLVLAPFAVLPVSISQITFTGISIVVFLLALLMVMSLTKQKISPQKILLLALLMQTFPVKFGLAMGQINLVILFLMVLGLWLNASKRKIDAAFFLALATVIKVIPIGLLPLFMFRREWRLVGWWLGFTTLFFALTPKLSLSYFSQIFTGLLQSASSWPGFYDQSLQALFLRLHLPHTLATIFYLVTVVSGYFFLLWRTRQFAFEKTVFVLLAWLSIAAPHAWQHYLVLAYPLLVIGELSLAALVGSWLALAFHFPNQDADYLKRWPLLASYQTIFIFFLTAWSVRWQKLADAVVKLRNNFFQFGN